MRISDWSSDVCSSDLDLGIRLDIVDRHRAKHERHGSAAGDAENESRNEGGLRCSVVGCLRAGNALHRALSDLLGPPGNPLLERGGENGGKRPTGPRPNTYNRADVRSAPRRRSLTAHTLSER